MQKAILAAVLCLTPILAARGDVLDLATSSDGVSPDTTSGMFGEALFEWTDYSGPRDVFVQLDAQGNSGFEQGYNTTVNGVFDNGSSDQFNHALLLTDIPLVDINGRLYRQFLLEVNEPLGQDMEFISLTEIQVLMSNTPNISSTDFMSDILQVPDQGFVYRLDDGVDHTIELNAALNPGAGTGDMFMYIPDDLFGSGLTYVYLYSAFGNFPADGNFEEWSVVSQRSTVIPEPTSMALFGVGLGILALRRRRRN